MKSLLALFLLAATARSAETRPNILFIAIDDQNDWIGHLGGHPLARTPHIDALAARGTTFLNAHCQAPICNPSRTSVLFGLRPGTTGIYGLQPAPRKAPILPVILENDREDVPRFAWYLNWRLSSPRLKWLRENNQWRNLVRSYLASTSFMDAQVGRFLKTLEETGRDKDTIVVLWSDHGWHLGRDNATYAAMLKHPDNGQPLSPHSAIRAGDHKLIWDWHGKLEIYDIPKDPAESNDLSQKMPELTSKLHTQLKQWLKENVATRYWPQRDETVSPTDAGGPFPFRDLC